MYQTKSPHTKLALSVIVAIAQKQSLDEIKSLKIPEELSQKLSCFVSIHLIDESLRGCIGTIEPREENLYQEIIQNAISACTQDSRFTPVRADELENITVSVDVLGKPYQIKSMDELNPINLGVIVSDGAYRRGVLLPNLETVDTVEKQLNIAKRKAGLQNMDNEALQIFAFTSTRYH
jgi:AmmeMemoRadiSam system protein A